jgi:oligoendopeptidase F
LKNWNWLHDRSELEAALEEDFAWRYIRMTCDTNSEEKLQNFQYFATEIEPKAAPYSNELNKKLVESPYFDNLDKDKYFVLPAWHQKVIRAFPRRKHPGCKPRSRLSSRNTSR